MFHFLKHRKYKNQVLGCLYSLLYLYPRGRDQITKDYPGVLDTIKTNYAENASPKRAALFAAAAILRNLVETLTDDQRAVIFQQLQQLDVREFKAVLRDQMAGKSTKFPEEITFGTIMFGVAVIMARALVDDREVEQSDYDMFASDVFGALASKSSQECASERILTLLDNVFPLPELREGDDGPLLPRQPGPSESPPLSGIEIKVKLVPTATGITLVKEDDGHQVTERRALTQDDLQKVPLDAEGYTFVNLQVPSGELYSCVITKPDAQAYGSIHAFWWSLAKSNVVTTDAKASGTRMTHTAHARVFAEARAMWDIAIKEAGSIERMRDLIVPLRNVHLTVISQMKEKITNEAAALGLDIALAMVLATQSEDSKLEAFAYRRFKRFLWQPGEEPREFYQHENG